MNKITKILGIFVAFFSVWFFTACAGGQPQPPQFAQPNPDFGIFETTDHIADEKQEFVQTQGQSRLNLAMPMPNTLNPLLNTNESVANILRLIFEPLAVIDAHGRAIANSAIVDSMVFSPSMQYITVTLHSNIFWQDNTAITSADIAFSIDVLRFNATENAIYKSNVLNIISHEILNEQSIIIHLNELQGYTKHILNFPIIPQAYYSQANMNNPSGPRNMHPLGNGPFRFLSYTQPRYIGLIASENAPGGTPNIMHVHINILRDYESEVFSFKRGLTDVLVSTPNYWGRYSAMGKNRAYDFLTNQFDFIGFNFNNDIFEDIYLRRAIAHLLDLQTILGRYYYLNDLAVAPISPSSYIFNNSIYYNFEPDTAVELLEGIGFIIGLDGKRQKVLYEELPVVLAFNIIVNKENTQRVGAAQILANSLENIGANVSLELLNFENFVNRVQNHEYDIFIGGVYLNTPLDLGFLHSQTSDIVNYTSHNLDLLLSLTLLTSNQNALLQTTSDLQHYIAYNLPIHGIAFKRQVLYTNSRVKGDIKAHGGDIFYNIQHWYIDN